MYIQLNVEDTEAFRELEAARKERLKNNVVEPSVNRSPVLEAITKYPKRITLAAGAFLSVK